MFKWRSKPKLKSKPFKNGMILPGAPHLSLYEIHPGAVKEIKPDSPFYDLAGDEIIMDEADLPSAGEKKSYP